VSRKTLAQRLDDSVRWTGIPDAAMRAPRRRPLRALSTLALTLATAGLIVMIAGSARLQWFGYGMIMLGFCFASFMPVWGPLKPWSTLVEPVDERERAVRARAFLIALSVIAFVAVCGLWLIVPLSILAKWSDNMLRMAILGLAFLIATLYSALPTCIASWSERPLPDDED
jgi:hypothetical protein